LAVPEVAYLQSIASNQIKAQSEIQQLMGAEFAGLVLNSDVEGEVGEQQGLRAV